MSRITQEQINEVCKLKSEGMKHRDIAEKVFGRRTKASTVWRILNNHFYNNNKTEAKEFTGAKILTIDIETSPILGAVWGLWQQNVGLNMIVQDWYVLSYAYKWMHEDEVVYNDIREKFDGTSASLLDDKDRDEALLKEVWKVLDEADIIVTQNGVKFDQKKLFARFLSIGLKPPSSFKHIDTLQIAKRHFAFTSNKLEYMTDKFCKKYKKLKHAKFAGFELWRQCMMGNVEAWEEMQEYNIYDVLSLEELVFVLAPWSNKLPNMDMYHNGLHNECFCGHDEWEHSGYAYTGVSKFDKFKCTKCGAERRSRVNILGKEKRKTLKANVAG